MSKKAQHNNGTAAAAVKTPTSTIDLTSKHGKKVRKKTISALCPKVRKEIIAELCRGYHSRGPISECPFCHAGMEAKLQEITAELNRGNGGTTAAAVKTPTINFDLAPKRGKKARKETLPVDAEGPYCFGFVAYDMSQSGTKTAVSMLQEITDVMRRGNDGGGSNEGFWVANSNTLLKKTIDPYKLAASHEKILVEHEKAVEMLQEVTAVLVSRGQQ